MEIKILPFRLNGRIGETTSCLPLEFKGLCKAFQMKYAETLTQIPMGLPKPEKGLHKPGERNFSTRRTNAGKMAGNQDFFRLKFGWGSEDGAVSSERTTKDTKFLFP
jgi:hypothetical protein